MRVLVVFCVLLGYAYGAQVDFKPYNSTALAMFHASDYDLDGCFTLTELHKVFEVYDTNHDGIETRHEYTVHITERTPELHDFAHVLYDDYNVIPDHHLDLHDYEAYYAKLDKNSDGCVVPDEFVEYWTAIFIANEHLHGHGTGK